MSKRKNQLHSPLIFVERGGLGALQPGICHEIINRFYVGASTRQAGLALLAERFGKSRTFFMMNGYGNNRQTDLQRADRFLIAHGRIVNYQDIPESQYEPYDQQPELFQNPDVDYRVDITPWSLQ